MIDSHSSSSAYIMRIEAVTATSGAHVAAAGKESHRWAGLLTTCHPHLARCIAGESVALVHGNVVRCAHVGRFHEVRQWVPCSDS